MLSLNQLKKLYTNSPLWMKIFYASIPFDIRNGKEYRNWREFLSKEIDIEEYELFKIKESVLYAYENTKYYRDLFIKLDINPHDIKSKQDFQKIPIIDKDIVRQNYNDFLVTDFPKKKILKVTTGGSSGTPMEYIQSKNVWSKELAYYMNFCAKSGYTASMIKASFRGGHFTKLTKDIYWVYNPVNNEMIFSPAHLSENTILKYVKELNKIKPSFFHGITSAIIFLMYHMEKKNLKFNFKIDAIFLVSESFTREDIEKISTYFNCKVASTYGHSERLVFAESIGNAISDYKINRTYGFFELIDEDNNSININNLKAEVIGTGFDNYAMPLLRYKTGDFTSFKDVHNGIINLVESSRSQLYIDCNDDSKISFPSFINTPEMLKLGIVKYQVIQNKVGKVKLYIIPSELFSKKNEQKLILSLNSRVNGRLNFEIIITNKLFFTDRGKCKLLIKEY